MFAILTSLANIFSPSEEQEDIRKKRLIEHYQLDANERFNIVVTEGTEPYITFDNIVVCAGSDDIVSTLLDLRKRYIIQKLTENS